MGKSDRFYVRVIMLIPTRSGAECTSVSSDEEAEFAWLECDAFRSIIADGHGRNFLHWTGSLILLTEFSQNCQNDILSACSGFHCPLLFCSLFSYSYSLICVLFMHHSSGLKDSFGFSVVVFMLLFVWHISLASLRRITYTGVLLQSIPCWAHEDDYVSSYL